MLAALLIGFSFGFVGSVPIAGPVSVLVFRCGLRGAVRSGQFVTLGAALPEGLYAFGACWGMGALLQRYPIVEPVTSAVAGAILLVVGFAISRRPPQEPGAETPRARKRSHFTLGFAISALNPTLLATWATAVAALHSAHLLSARASNAVPFGLGVAGGIVVWFFLMLELMGRYKHRFSWKSLGRMQQLVGVALAGMGLVLLGRVGLFVARI